MRTKLAALVCAVALFALQANAGMTDDLQKLVGDNATSYIHPYTNAMGEAMNSGWYNSSKSYSFLKVPVGLQVYFGSSVTAVDDNLKKYNFHGAIGKASLTSLPGVPAALSTAISSFGGDSLYVNIPGAATVVGAKGNSSITFWQLLGQNGIDTSGVASTLTPSSTKNQQVLFVPGGQDQNWAFGIPPAVGVNIGLPFKVQLGVRFLPPLKAPVVGKVSQFGFKTQYEFTQWIPIVAHLPLLHTSAMYSYNAANIGDDMLKLKNWTAMLNASGDFSLGIGLGVYGGIGFEGSTMELNYKLPADMGPLAGLPVKLSDKGDNFFRANIGARFSFAIFDIMADATFGKTTSYYLGLGLGFNNL